MTLFKRLGLRSLGPIAAGAGLMAVAGGAALTGQALVPALQSPAQAQQTPSLMEFRWDTDRDYRKLYYFLSDAGRNKRADYYLILKAKDRKTAILKLTIKFPSYWEASLKAKDMQLCYMKEGGMAARTRCETPIPATIEVSPNGKAIEVYPNTPVPDNKTVGLYFTTTNPFNIGMFQINALIQPPGDIPVSTYVGSWLIEITPD